MDTTNQQTPQTGSFRGLGLAPKLLETLDALKFSAPTPIQKQAIPPALAGKDVVGVAQTGTGKTLAFGIPLLQRLAETGGQGLILLPTRELAVQVEHELQKIGKAFQIRTAVLIGGVSIVPQIRSLRVAPHIIIATPGRLLDHIQEKTLSLSRSNFVVFDEADRMLDMGFAPQIQRVLALLPKERQTLLFSATLSKEIMQIAMKHMRLPVRIEVAPPGTTVDRVSQEFFIVRKDDKMRLLEKILTERTGSVIVFARMKHSAHRIAAGVRTMGHRAAEMHSNRSQNQRQEALQGFKTGAYRVLVATDIAARGIDVKGVELVINYDLPMQTEDYVHRIGRTARAGVTGHAISFAMPGEERDIRDIERLIRKQIPVAKLPELPPRRAQEHSSLPPSSYPSRGRSFSSSRSYPPSRSHSFSAGPSRAGAQSHTRSRSYPPHRSYGSSGSRPRRSF